MSSSPTPQDWATVHRSDDGEQQPISLMERMFGLEAQSKRFGLEVMRPLAKLLGDPQLDYPTIHVAGSKGKGSTVAFISSVLQATGARVATYVSPSLTFFGERICIDGEPISEPEIERLVTEILSASEKIGERPKFFEAATLAAFLHFRQHAVDVAVIEVGIGGLRDATNIVSPEACVITGIELEHTAILGRSIEEIAREKAGIIKPGCPVISGVTLPDARNVISEVAEQVGAPLYEIDTDFSVTVKDADRHGQRISVHLGSRIPFQSLDDVQLSLPGKGQARNAALAVCALAHLATRFPEVNSTAIRSGMLSARWPGRLELVSEQPGIVLDIAHTPSSAEQLRDYVDRFYSESSHNTLVFGMLRDKDAHRLAEILAPVFHTIRVAPVKWFRSMTGEDVRAEFAMLHNQVKVHESIKDAVHAAVLDHAESGLIVIAGSAFAVGEAKRGFGF